MYICTQCGHADYHHAAGHCSACFDENANHDFTIAKVDPATGKPARRKADAKPVTITNPLDIVTEACDGYVVTLKCQCGWEAMYILPEECFVYLIGVLTHAKEVHGTVMPDIEHRTL